MTPVPLELPLNPAEAAELANLVFEQAERKPLNDEVRNRIAGRAAMLKLQSMTPYPGSLERDPVHHSVYYMAVDAGSEPLLLHMALGTAPTSSIYQKPLLICRGRRNHGPEIVINSIPFGPDDHASVETFAARINSVFYPQPQGGRSTITVERDYAAAFTAFRRLQKRTGKNLAAFSGNYHGALCAAVRAGWRTPYTVASDVVAAPDSPGFSRYTLLLASTMEGLEQAERQYQRIRQARAAAKITRAFDFALEAVTPLPLEFLRATLAYFKERGHPPQLIAPRLSNIKDLDEMAATALQFQTTLSFGYGGEASETLQAIARGTGGRFDVRVRDAAELDLVTEQLL